MHFFPILSTLRRHRTAAALIVLQIALTCAIVCNCIFLIRERLHRMDVPSGVAEDEIVRIQIAGVDPNADHTGITAQDLAALAAIPGVKAAANTNMIPFGGSSWNSSISAKPDDPERPVNAAMYMGSKDFVETLGVQITGGHDFEPQDYATFKDILEGKARLSMVLLSRAACEKLWPGEDPVGKKVYVYGEEPQIVVGVFERLARPNESGGKSDAEYAMILPVTLPYTDGNEYLIRTEPGRRAEVLAASLAALDKVDPSRVILEKQFLTDVRKHYFRNDRAMAYLLVGVCVALLVITALGVVGLASFWVQQRRRQIGIRRALGATRSEILRYFQTENFILATVGIIVGMVMAYGINLWLMDKYKVGRLPWEYLPLGALLLWTLGQIAVLGPALRASSVPPAVATRTV